MTKNPTTVIKLLHAKNDTKVMYKLFQNMQKSSIECLPLSWIEIPPFSFITIYNYLNKSFRVILK